MDEILPESLKCGITYKEFWHLTPDVVLKIHKAEHEKRKREIEDIEQHAWLTGQYVLAAIGVSFSKKKKKYPENPAVVREKNRTDFTEEEKMKYVETLFGQLDTMKNNFERNHKNGEKH